MGPLRCPGDPLRSPGKPPRGRGDVLQCFTLYRLWFGSYHCCRSECFWTITWGWHLRYSVVPLLIMIFISIIIMIILKKPSPPKRVLYYMYPLSTQSNQINLLKSNPHQTEFCMPGRTKKASRHLPTSVAPPSLSRMLAWVHRHHHNDDIDDDAFNTGHDDDDDDIDDDDVLTSVSMLPWVDCDPDENNLFETALATAILSDFSPTFTEVEDGLLGRPQYRAKEWVGEGWPGILFITSYHQILPIRQGHFHPSVIPTPQCHKSTTQGHYYSINAIESSSHNSYHILLILITIPNMKR